MILFKFGDLVFDKYIKYDGYDQTPNARQDLDSYRDADGFLQRNALKVTATSIEFITYAMWSEKFHPMIDEMVASYINVSERDAMCEYYDFETHTQKTGHFYLDSNWKPKVSRVLKNGRIFYGETNFAFVDYGHLGM